MAKSSAGAGYRCTECGWQATKWTGRCGECQAWGTVEEAGGPRLARAGIRAVSHGRAAPARTPAVPIGQVDATDASARPTGLDELDRVLGGGLVPGAVLLLAGEPGVGKSTLLLAAAAAQARPFQSLDLRLLVDTQDDGLSGGLRYRPSTSRTLASSCGSVENLKVSHRQGCSPYSATPSPP